jgi:hypothetical protein
LIGNAAYQELDRNFLDVAFFNPPDVGVDLPPAPPFLREDFGDDFKQDGYSGELSHLFSSQYVNTVAGAGYFNIEQDRIASDIGSYPGNPDFGIPPTTFFDLTDKTKTDVDHINTYLYSYVKPLKNLTLTIGASVDFFKSDERGGNENDLEKDQFNPKIGIVWNPFSNTIVRGAAFRTLKRTLITDQTLEPTQVAGFNQFFDDFDATETWVYGGAIDQKFSQSLYGGVEYFRRELEVPFFTLTSEGVIQLNHVDWKEDIGRAYLYWTPHRWVALKAEYRYEKFERDPEFNSNINSVKTHSFPMGINFSHPSGVSASLGVTYYDQKGEFQREEVGIQPIEQGSDDFWVADAAISYRLPKRYGFLTVGVTNLFDEKFQYADTDLDNPRIQPERSIFAKVTLAIP